MPRIEDMLDCSVVLGIRSESKLGRMAKNLEITVQFCLFARGSETKVYYFMPFSEYQARDYRIFADAADARKIDDFYIFEDEADTDLFRNICNLLKLNGVAFRWGEMVRDVKYVCFDFPHAAMESVSDGVLQLILDNEAYSLEFIGNRESLSRTYPFRRQMNAFTEVVFRLGKSDYSGRNIEMELKVMADRNAQKSIFLSRGKITENPIGSVFAGELLEVFADYPLCTNGISVLLRQDHLHISVRCDEIYLRSLERAMRKFAIAREIPLSIDVIR